jgi:hypothetical protein
MRINVSSSVTKAEAKVVSLPTKQIESKRDSKK